jgi:hypothetical protein
MSKAAQKTPAVRGVEERSGKLWVWLPRLVVDARAGLIPSYATDANPPPEGLTAAEIRLWHLGLPVELKSNFRRESKVTPATC